MHPRRLTVTVAGMLPESCSPDLPASDLVLKMRSEGLSVTTQFYGFFGQGDDPDGGISFECGMEHDGSISLSVTITARSPPVVWCFLDSFPAAADLLLDAQRRIQQGASATWAVALEAAHAARRGQQPLCGAIPGGVGG